MIASGRREYNRRYYQENRERLLEENRKRRVKNREKYMAARRAKYAANPEPLKEKARAYRKNNPEARMYAEARKYGLTDYQFHILRSTHGDSCAICHKPREMGSLCIDHDHATQMVRGLLCSECNLAVGKMADDPQRLRRAAAYLDHPWWMKMREHNGWFGAA